jgi:hypothetical protein
MPFCYVLKFLLLFQEMINSIVFSSTVELGTVQFFYYKTDTVEHEFLNINVK